jgi:hypothetical protein
MTLEPVAWFGLSLRSVKREEAPEAVVVSESEAEPGDFS